MPSFITESLIYKAFEKILINPYRYSVLKKFLDRVIILFKNSFIFISFEKYLEKEPYFTNSFSYYIFRKIIKFLDKIMDKIHNFFKKLIINSLIYEEVSSIKKMNIEKRFLILAIIVFSFSIGNTIGNIIFPETTNSESPLTMMLCFFGAIFAISGVNPDVYKDSLSFKIIKYLFELVKL